VFFNYKTTKLDKKIVSSDFASKSSEIRKFPYKKVFHIFKNFVRWGQFRAGIIYEEFEEDSSRNKNVF
jgi:hypothetical protein